LVIWTRKRHNDSKKVGVVRKNIVPLMAMFIGWLSLGAASPCVMAIEATPQDGSVPPSSTAVSQTAGTALPVGASSLSSKSKSTFGSRLASLPLETVGVLTGIVVGIPVNAVRRPIANEKYGVEQMNGDNHQSRVVIPAAVFYSPFALMAGVLESPWYAVNNSLLNYDKPFSKEQFSIADTPKPLPAK
jgi:hypothetical protein